MLTDTQVRNAKPTDKPYKLTDGDGLHIEITPQGSKLWRFRYRFSNKESMLSLGSYPATSLAQARQGRDQARKLLAHGSNPALHRRQEKQRLILEQKDTFEAVARELMGRKTLTKETFKQNLRILEADFFPKIGCLPIKSITPADILSIIQDIERRGSVSIALKARSLAGEVFRHGCATLRCESDPAATLRGVIKSPPTKHAEPFSKGELATLLDRLDGYGHRGNRLTAIALQLLLLTFVRTTELQGAAWGEIDFQNALWRIPAERMKMKTQHIVPLSQQAIALLEELKEISGQQQYLFPNVRRSRNHMQRTTFNRALENMGIHGHSGHDFRATASTYLYEMGYRTDLIEKQLAHQERDKVRAAYNHAEYLPERRKMMQQYADFISSLKDKKSNIVPFRQVT